MPLPTKSCTVYGVPTNKKQIQILKGRLLTLNRFISKYSNRMHQFFLALESALKKGWNEDCQKAFDSIKQYLTEPSILSQQLPDEKLYIYLATSAHVVSTVLLIIENETQ